MHMRGGGEREEVGTLYFAAPAAPASDFQIETAWLENDLLATGGQSLQTEESFLSS